jgi:hypothetical protein
MGALTIGNRQGNKRVNLVSQRDDDVMAIMQCVDQKEVAHQKQKLSVCVLDLTASQRQ